MVKPWTCGTGTRSLLPAELGGLRTRVSDDYTVPFAFNGKIRR
jgi:hypothetical protein